MADNMQITDPVYGSFNIQDKVLLDLMRSGPMERVKHISQQGIPKEFDANGGPNHSRYEHCVGVMLILRKLGAGLEEQASGLLHDVSHTAFSHTADMVFGSYADQGLQDSIHNEYFEKGELPGILEKHGYDPKRISNEKLFGLLEREIPDVCADRVDYSLRGRYYQKGMESIEIAEHLLQYHGEMAFDSIGYAVAFSKLFMHMQRSEYGNMRNIAVRYAFSTAIKAALDAGAVTKEDILYGTDDAVVEKARKAGIAYVDKVFDSLRKGEFSVAPGGSIHLKAKPRYVDPKFVDNGALKKASEADSGTREMIRKSVDEDTNGYMVRMKVGDIVLG